MAEVINGIIPDSQENNTAAPSQDKNIPNSVKAIADYVLGNLHDEKQPIFTQLFQAKETVAPILVKFQKSSEKATDSPTVSDLINATSLDLAVPTGFLLLHNDFRDLISSQETSANGKKSTLRVSEGESSLDISFGDLLKGVFVSKGGSSIVAQGSGMAAKAFAPAIANLGKVAGFLTNPAVLGTAAAAAAVALLIKYIKGSEQRKAEDHMNHLMNELTMEVSLEDLKKNPKIIQKRDDAFTEYLEVYYNSQIRNMKMDSFLSGVVDAAMGMVNAFFGNLFGKKEASALDTLIVSLVDNVTKQADVEKISKLPIVQQARDEGIAEYIKAYYASQAFGLKADALGSGLGDLITSFATSLFSGIFNKAPEPTSPLTTLMLSLTELVTKQADVDKISELPTVQQARDEGIAKYVKAYYASQAFGLKTDAIGDGLGDLLTSFATSLFSGIFGKEEEKTSLQQTLISLTSALDNTINVNDYKKDDIILGYQKEGIGAYVKAYYDTQAKALLSEDVGAAAGEKVKGFFTGLFGGDNNEETDFNKSIKSLLDISSLVNSQDIIDLKTTESKNFLNNYFKNITDSVSFAKLDADSVADINYAFKNAIVRALNDRTSTGVKAETIFNSISNKDSSDLLDAGRGRLLVDDVSTIKLYMVSIAERLINMENQLAGINTNTAQQAPPIVIPASNKEQLNLEA